MLPGCFAIGAVLLAVVGVHAIEFGFGNFCAKNRFERGSCVPSRRCRNPHQDRWRQCGGQVCCSQRDLLSSPVSDTRCFSRFGRGSCVASHRCRFPTHDGPAICGGDVCCSQRNIIQSGGTTQPPTTEPPTTQPSDPFQLVKDCGRRQFVSILFPQSAPEDARFRRSAKRGSPGPGALSFAGDGPPVVVQVVGGENAREGRWPWAVLLGVRAAGDDEPRWICGGTLITAHTVLTAAHCLTGRRAGQLTARLGEHDLSRTTDGRHVDAAVRDLLVHPDYRASQNDIALAVLTRPAQLGGRVRPACLPPPNADHTGRTAQLAGWGRTEFGGDTAPVLQEVALRVLDARDCERKYRQATSFDRTFPGGFQGTKLCAGTLTDQPADACQGDSGGPLVIGDGAGRYQVIGVVSTGLGCGNPNFPGVYTKVSKYVRWIVDNSR